MVGRFLRLKLRLFRNSLRGDTTRVIGVVGGLVLAALLGLGGGTGLVFLHGCDAAATTGPLIYLGLFLGWIILPLITFSADETLDPTRLCGGGGPVDPTRRGCSRAAGHFFRQRRGGGR